jgi:membrane associated rhomboid family serine protease
VRDCDCQCAAAAGDSETRRKQGGRLAHNLTVQAGVTFMILLAVIAAVAYRVASLEERERGLRLAIDLGAVVKRAAIERRCELGEYRRSLRAWTPRPFVTAAIALVFIGVGAGMLFGAARMADPDTLIAWGASVGPRTTHGEWWRLLTSSFVHASALHLFINVVVLVQVGTLVERLAGRPAVAAVYLSAGVIAGLLDMSAHPVAVTVAASGALAGLYGLLTAVIAGQQVRLLVARYWPKPSSEQTIGEPINETAGWATGEPIGETDHDAAGCEPDLTIPIVELKALVVIGALFLLYSAIVSATELWGFAVGAAYGIALAQRVERQPSPRRVAAAAAIAAALAATVAWPLRNIADVKPEIARVIAAEEHTTRTYQAALDAFKKGRGSADAVVRVAERANVEELQAVDARLAALEHVPLEDQPIVSDARTYLKLRCDAWKLRADALRRVNAAAPRAPADDQPNGVRRLQREAQFRSNMTAMGRAESAERASQSAFERVRAPAPAAQ